MGADIVVEHVGKNCLLHSRTDAGKRWIERHYPIEQWRRILGWTVAIEDLRMVHEISQAAEADGVLLDSLDAAVYDC